MVPLAESILGQGRNRGSAVGYGNVCRARNLSTIPGMALLRFKINLALNIILSSFIRLGCLKKRSCQTMLSNHSFLFVLGHGPSITAGLQCFPYSQLALAGHWRQWPDEGSSPVVTCTFRSVLHLDLVVGVGVFLSMVRSGLPCQQSVSLGLWCCKSGSRLSSTCPIPCGSVAGFGTTWFTCGSCRLDSVLTSPLIVRPTWLFYSMSSTEFRITSNMARATTSTAVLLPPVLVSIASRALPACFASALKCLGWKILPFLRMRISLTTMLIQKRRMRRNYRMM